MRGGWGCLRIISRGEGGRGREGTKAGLGTRLSVRLGVPVLESDGVGGFADVGVCRFGVPNTTQVQELIVHYIVLFMNVHHGIDSATEWRKDGA